MRSTILDAEKENRLPRSMAVPSKPVGNTTPGRRGKKGTNNQYFEVGKVGRYAQNGDFTVALAKC
jgi:hypothetical protein